MDMITMVGSPGTTLSCASELSAKTGQGIGMSWNVEYPRTMAAMRVAPRRHLYDGTRVSITGVTRLVFVPGTAVDLGQIKQKCVPSSPPERGS
jgi:hypothetical protein